MKTLFCQSCGMPMADPNLLGTNKNGTDNHDYCIHCYKEGAFTQNLTMDEMIEHCTLFLDEFNKDSTTQMNKEEAIANMRKFFPELKRWKNQAEK